MVAPLVSRGLSEWTLIISKQKTLYLLKGGFSVERMCPGLILA